MRLERDAERKSSDIDITAWQIGLYVRSAIVSALNSSVQYPNEPLSVQGRKAKNITAKDQAEEFRAFLKQYKRRPVAKQGGETHGD